MIEKPPSSFSLYWHKKTIARLMTKLDTANYSSPAVLLNPTCFRRTEQLQGILTNLIKRRLAETQSYQHESEEVMVYLRHPGQTVLKSPVEFRFSPVQLVIFFVL